SRWTPTTLARASSTNRLVSRRPGGITSEDWRPMSTRDLEVQYRATTYQATIAGETIALRIDDRAGRLAAVLHGAKVDEWVFITAWNPGSTERPGHENDGRQRELE